MALNIGIGIDVDSRSVTAGAAALDKYGRELKDVETGLRGVEAAGRGAAAPLGQIGRSTGEARIGLAAVRGETTAFGRAMNEARLQSIGFGAGVAGIVSPMLALRGAMAALGSGLLISDMRQFTADLQRVQFTLLQVTGSTGAAAAEFEYLRETAGRLGQSYMAIAGDYSRLLASASAANVPIAQTRTLFEGVTAASTAFGLSQEQTAGALNALQQMMSKGTVSAEELRGQLGERLPGAFAIAARAMDMTGAELNKALEQGAISANEFVDAFGREMLNTFGDAAASADNVITRTNDLTNAMDDLRIVVAESGFRQAMVDVLGALAEFAQSDLARGIARDLGESFSDLSGSVVALLNPLETLESFDSPFADWMAEVIQTGIWINDLIAATGGLGGALDMLRDVALEAWDRIGIAADAMRWLVDGAFLGMKAGAVEALNGIVQAALNAFRSVSNMWNAIAPELNLPVIDTAGIDSFAASMQNAADTARLIAEDTSSLGRAAMEAAQGPLKSVAAMNDLVAQTQEASQETTRLAAAANAVAGAPGGGASGRGIAGAAKSAKTVRDELARAKDILEDQRQSLNATSLEWAKAEQGSEFVRRETDKLGEALEKSNTSLADFLASQNLTVDQYTRMLEIEEELQTSMAERSRLAGEIADGMNAIMGGDIRGGLSGVIGGMTENVGGAFQAALDDLADDIAGSFQRMTQGSRMDPVAVSGVGAGIGSAAIGVLEGNSQQVGAGIGQAAGAALGSFIPVLGPALGGVLGGAAGGLLSKLFGSDTPTTIARGTAFEGTSYEQRNVGGREYSLEEGKTGALDIVQSGLRKLLENFDREMTQVARDFVADVNAVDFSLAVEDIDKARELIAGTLSDTIYESKGATETAAEIERRVGEFMTLSTQIATAGRVAATETQVAFREINDQFSRSNVEILRAVGFTAGEIRRAERVAVQELQTGVAQEMLDTLIDLGAASEDELKQWRRLQFQALADRREAAIATAREIGGDVKLVRRAFNAQKNDISDQYRDMLSEMGDATVSFADRMAASINRLNTLAGGLQRLVAGGVGGAGTIRRMGRVQDRAARAEWRAGKDEMLDAGMTRREWRQGLRAAGAANNDDIRAALRDLREAGRAGRDARKTERRDRDNHNRQVRDGYERVNKGIRDGVDRTVRDVITAMDRLQFRENITSMIAGGPNATGRDMRLARDAELAVARQAHRERVREARKMGVSVALLERAAAAERQGIMKSYAERMAGIINGPLDKAIARMTDRVGKMTERLTEMEQRRSEVVGELQRRYDDARAAEIALADARAGLSRSAELAPGGPMERLAELQRQFGAAVKAARGGDAGAASTAAGLAQELLGAGRETYASGDRYAALFSAVNRDLLAAQKGFDKSADRIEPQLDKATFSAVTEKSTTALLKALGTLNGSIAGVEKQIDTQNRLISRTEAKKRVA